MNSAVEINMLDYNVVVFLCVSVILENVIINVTSIGRQISELMFLW